MVSLLDIAPLTEEVTVRGEALSVAGVSANSVAALLSRFPDLQALFKGEELGADRLFAFGAEAIAAIIACGFGHPGDAEYEAAASRLGLEEQADVIEAVIRLTLPRGLGPFVEKLTRVGTVLSGTAGSDVTKASDTRSPKP